MLSSLSSAWCPNKEVAVGKAKSQPINASSTLPALVFSLSIMAHPALRTTVRCSTRRVIFCPQSISSRQQQCAHLRTSSKLWFFKKFLTPEQEHELFLGITSAFRKNLGQDSPHNQSYAEIIEQAILATSSFSPKHRSPMTLERFHELSNEIDQCGKAKDVAKLQSLWAEMDVARITAVGLYNRLIRAYIAADATDDAERVLQGLKARKDIMPTARSFTYLIRAHIQAGERDKARQLVEQMQRLSLLRRLRTAFDCHVLMQYYIECNETHALDFLWKDLVQHADSIKPGFDIYTLYMKWLLSEQEHNQPEKLNDVAQHMLHTIGGNNGKKQQRQIKEVQHIQVLLEAGDVLGRDHAYADTAEGLMSLVVKSPNFTSEMIPKGMIGRIVDTFLKRGQDLKAMMFYYRLGQAGVSETAIGRDVLISMSKLLDRLEQRTDLEEYKGIIAQLHMQSI